MTGRIAFLFLAIVVLAGPQPVNSQRAENFSAIECRAIQMKSYFGLSRTESA
jgi:hypothetical protein